MRLVGMSGISSLSFIAARIPPDGLGVQLKMLAILEAALLTPPRLNLAELLAAVLEQWLEQVLQNSCEGVLTFGGDAAQLWGALDAHSPYPSPRSRRPTG
jgi:hypothetical protein